LIPLIGILCTGTCTGRIPLHLQSLRSATITDSHRTSTWRSLRSSLPGAFRLQAEWGGRVPVPPQAPLNSRLIMSPVGGVKGSESSETRTSHANPPDSFLSHSANKHRMIEPKKHVKITDQSTGHLTCDQLCGLNKHHFSSLSFRHHLETYVYTANHSDICK